MNILFKLHLFSLDGDVKMILVIFIKKKTFALDKIIIVFHLTSEKHDLILILRVRNVSKRLLPVFPIACVSCILEPRSKCVHVINNPLVQIMHVQ